jgi:hypothetical protein
MISPLKVSKVSPDCRSRCHPSTDETVFESSARLAILAKHTSQLMSSISGLVPGLYQAVDDRKGKGKAKASAVDDIPASLEEISLDQNEVSDERVQFASILLLLQLVQSENPAAFHSILTILTSPIVVRLHPKPSSNYRPPERTGRRVVCHPSLTGYVCRTVRPPFVLCLIARRTGELL